MISKTLLPLLPYQIEHGIANIQTDAKSFANWATQNGFERNLEKKNTCKGDWQYILYQVHRFCILPPITMNNFAIRYVHLFKNLGVHITYTFIWNPYVDNILKKVYLSLGSLKFN